MGAGFGGQPEDPGTLEEQIDSINAIDVVNVEVENFKAQAIALHHMPGMGMLDIMTSQNPGAMFSMFQLALSGQKAHDDLEILNFSELQAAVAQKIQKSTEKQMETMLKKVGVDLGSGEGADEEVSLGAFLDKLRNGGQSLPPGIVILGMDDLDGSDGSDEDESPENPYGPDDLDS